jgi:hypothetical protein
VNAFEKLQAILASDEIRIWIYTRKLESSKFFYWMENIPKDNDGHEFNTLEQLIDAAYARIDPLLKPLPSVVPRPRYPDMARISRDVEESP